MAEHDRRRFAAMFAADAELDVGTARFAFFDSNLHQTTNADLVQNLERVRRENVLFLIVVDKASIIATRNVH